MPAGFFYAMIRRHFKVLNWRNAISSSKVAQLEVLVDGLTSPLRYRATRRLSKKGNARLVVGLRRWQEKEPCSKRGGRLCLRFWWWPGKARGRETQRKHAAEQGGRFGAVSLALVVAACCFAAFFLWATSPEPLFGVLSAAVPLSVRAGAVALGAGWDPAMPTAGVIARLRMLARSAGRSG